MKKLTHTTIYYVGVSTIFLSVLAVLLSIVGLFSKYIGVESFSSEILHMSVIMFSVSMSIATYLNLFFLHRDISELKETVIKKD